MSGLPTTERAALRAVVLAHLEAQTKRRGYTPKTFYHEVVILLSGYTHDGHKTLWEIVCEKLLLS